MNMKQFNLVKKFLKECEETTFNFKNSKTFIFKNPITFLKIQNYLQQNLDNDEFEKIGINYGNIDSMVCQIMPEHWSLVTMLPVQKFKGENANTVYKNSKRKF